MNTTIVSIPSNEEVIHIESEIQRYLPGAKALLVKGYSAKNKDYKKAKAPVSTGWGLNEKVGQTTFKNYIPPTETEINNHIRNQGWVGAALDESYCVVDIDSILDKHKKNVLIDGHVVGKMLFDLLKSQGVKFHAFQTPNGMQFIFKHPKGSKFGNKVKTVTPLGLQTDYRVAGGMIVWPTESTDGRYILHTCQEQLDEVPGYLHPLYRPSFNKEDEPNFPVFPFDEGGRNDSMNRFLFLLRANGGDKINATMIQTVAHLVNNHFTNPPLDTGELEATIRSVLSAGIDPSRQSVQTVIDTGEHESSNDLIPQPYYVHNGLLKKTIEKKTEDIQVTVCRHIPFITQSFANVEKSQLHHEVQWVDRGREYRETVPAGALATKKELLKLADQSLGVTDINARDLIDFFDKYIMLNDIPRGNLVERLGHVKGGFIHPLMSEDIKILPPDVGDKQTVEAFEAVGTSDGWIENVFNQIKDHPKAVIMLLGSFTSVILNDLKQSPFIIDLSGPTSKGKTTILKVAASVWGTGHLVGEWNITKVAAERKAAFLNSFPLMLDDTMKADEKQLKNFVYNFSGGRSKGRGSITGTQIEHTWNNLLLSTGESSLTEYAMQAAGAAARVLPITGLPFDDVEYEFFNELYEAIEDNHGAIGIDFLKHWQDKKEILLPLYNDFNTQFQRKSNGNEVLGRIARHYAALVFTAHVLNNFFQMDINLNELTNLFDEVAQENKAIDKPMQLLEAILTDLEATRESVSGKYAVRHDMKAIYQNGTLYLLPKFLKEFLKTEQSAVRSEWLRRGISIGSMRNGKETDTRQIKHDGKNFSPVAIDPAIINSLGFNFEENY